MKNTSLERIANLIIVKVDDKEYPPLTRSEVFGENHSTASRGSGVGT